VGVRGVRGKERRGGCPLRGEHFFFKNYYK